ncbi:MAG: sulfurtransferase TusA family protein [Deltaproteobacteria bacterium]|nr:sulfurtransferase TusA family protein [Deltaproteobacteria bacterium]
MGQIIDERGLSCPQPVLDFLNQAARQKKGDLTVLVDTDTARENVIRAADRQGWQLVDLTNDGPTSRLSFRKT